MRVISERLRGVFTTRRYTQLHVYLYLYLYQGGLCGCVVLVPGYS